MYIYIVDSSHAIGEMIPRLLDQGVMAISATRSYQFCYGAPFTNMV